MEWGEAHIRLRPRPRGLHLVTDEIVAGLPELARFALGTAQLFLQHTSASLLLNENADPAVRHDLETWLRRAVPDGADYFGHDAEGPDDMPAHVKAALLGTSLTIPIRDGALALGTWQGVYLGEHRERAGSRSVLVTLMGRR